jgi:hypothetical protein
MMIAPVDPYVAAFAEAGAAHILVHPEAGPHLHRTLQLIRSLGKRAGVVLSPATPADAVAWVLDLVDIILVMTANPRFGGQVFLASMLPKITALRRMIDASGRSIALSVDGGITAETAPHAIAAGADTLVAGTAVFTAPTMPPQSHCAAGNAWHECEQPAPLAARCTPGACLRRTADGGPRMRPGCRCATPGQAMRARRWLLRGELVVAGASVRASGQLGRCIGRPLLDAAPRLHLAPGPASAGDRMRRGCARAPRCRVIVIAGGPAHRPDVAGAASRPGSAITTSSPRARTMHSASG